MPDNIAIFIGGSKDGQTWPWPNDGKVILNRAWKDGPWGDVVIERYEWQGDNLVFTGLQNDSKEA